MFFFFKIDYFILNFTVFFIFLKYFCYRHFFLVLENWRNNKNRMRKITITRILTFLTQQSVSCPVIPIQVNFLDLINNITDKFSNIVFKQLLVVMNSYHKLFKGNSTSTKTNLLCSIGRRKVTTLDINLSQASTSSI